MQQQRGMGMLDSGILTTTHIPSNIMYSTNIGTTDVSYQPAVSYSLTSALNSAGKIS